MVARRISLVGEQGTWGIHESALEDLRAQADIRLTRWGGYGRGRKGRESTHHDYAETVCPLALAIAKPRK